MNELSDELAARLQLVEELINTGEWSRAQELAESNVTHEVLSQYSRAWVQLTLLAALRKDVDEFDRAKRGAKNCDNFTPCDEGDLFRDHVNMLMKLEGRIAEAQRILDAARRHEEMNDSDDKRNRLIVLHGFQGRVELRRKNALAALRFHEEADERWAELDDANHQWQLNNLLHWLIAAMTCWRLITAWNVFKRLWREERNPKRKKVALVVLVGGPLACRWALSR